MYKQMPSRIHVRVYSLNAIFFSFFNYFVQTRYDTGTCYCLNNLSNRVEGVKIDIPSCTLFLYRVSFPLFGSLIQSILP